MIARFMIPRRSGKKNVTVPAQTEKMPRTPT